MDALIIGAGPAGLVAATYLGRFHRDVVVVDSGAPRADWIPVSHNIPGFPDGIGGPALLRRLRDQAMRYGARLVGGDIAQLARTPDGGFTARLDSTPIAASRVLIATGGVDREPDLPGIRNAVRRGLVRHCPVCDAFEVTGQRVALIGYGKCRVREALMLRAYTDDLTVLTLGRSLDIAPDDAHVLEAAGIRLLREPVARLTIEADRIAEWHMESGASHRFDTLYSALGWEPRSSLAREIGVELDEDGAILVDAHHETRIPGLFAAGDVVQGLSQVSVAAGGAAIAALAINRSLPYRPYQRPKPARGAGESLRPAAAGA